MRRKVLAEEEVEEEKEEEKYEGEKEEEERRRKRNNRLSKKFGIYNFTYYHKNHTSRWPSEMKFEAQSHNYFY